MRTTCLIWIFFGLLGCDQQPRPSAADGTGIYSGTFRYGDFSDDILVSIEKDSTRWQVFFSSLAQNANRIPFQEIEVNGDSINFKLRSDFYTYSFKNRWTDHHAGLEGSLQVDTITATYTLAKDVAGETEETDREEISFTSGGITLKGTIWHPEKDLSKGLIIVTSSGNADRSASAAEAKLFAQRGYTTFHYDKRGTGSSAGDWTSATIEELSQDDINAIQFFSSKTGIPLTSIGIKGSSQGGAKMPYILNALEDLAYGVAVSCPGVSLLESDLNYWTNRNTEVIGAGDIREATTLQRKVFEHIAGEFSRSDLEEAISKATSKPWFAHIWIPDLDEVKEDKKLLFNPIPHFEKVKHPVLIIQGTLDEIIPVESYKTISDALDKANNTQYKTVLLDGGSHSMYYVGNSDFPYWSKLHPMYITIFENWVKSVSADK